MIETFGYPRPRLRRADFASLVLIILEQQVSIASARAVYNKLEGAVGQITPQAVYDLDDGVFADCGFSRQKKRYVKELAFHLLSGDFDMKKFKTMDNTAVRNTLLKVKGIGPWTCDVFLLFCLGRCDIFPAGDLALVKSMQENGFISKKADKQKILAAAEPFRPHRSMFAHLLWHAYLVKRGFPIS